jgi:hypothetical protein
MVGPSAWGASRANAAEGAAAAGLSEPARGESFVSVITQPSGEPILAVNYPWARHAKPSIELLVLDPSEVDDPLIRPLFFRHDVMKGNVTKAVYQCQDRSEHTRQTATFSHGNADFEVFGARNSLGRPAACVAWRKTPTIVSPEAESRFSEGALDELKPLLSSRSEPETRAAYCLLDAWAIDERALYLDLPASYFSRPSKVRVWFLRGNDIVWTADVKWPGTPE